MPPRITSASSPLLSDDLEGEYQWSIRILLLAVAGILFLTLYPFQFLIHPFFHAAASPFLLQGSSKPTRPLDDFLNVLLFAPFGFGLAGVLRARGISLARTPALALAAGALLSYTIEFVQFFIPERDSGWRDVFTNSGGALAGSGLFLLCGLNVLRVVTRTEKPIERFASGFRTGLSLLLYFCIWFSASAWLQTQTKIDNWLPQESLSVAPSTPKTSQAAGRVDELQFWDYALPARTARSLMPAGSAHVPAPDSLAAYEFYRRAPFEDQRHLLPNLQESPPDPFPASRADATHQDRVSTPAPVTALVSRIKETGRFSVYVLYQPGSVEGSAQILSIDRSGQFADMRIRQQGPNLLFYFRNRLSVEHPLLALNVQNVFARGQQCAILFTYDGSRLATYINGRGVGANYKLTPATALAAFVRQVRTPELQGYRYVYYALLFFPAGLLLGIAARNQFSSPWGMLMLFVFGLLLPPVLLEFVLTRVGGQPLSYPNIALAMIGACAGAVWINVGRKFSSFPASQDQHSRGSVS